MNFIVKEVETSRLLGSEKIGSGIEERRRIELLEDNSVVLTLYYPKLDREKKYKFKFTSQWGAEFFFGKLVLGHDLEFIPSGRLEIRNEDIWVLLEGKILKNDGNNYEFERGSVLWLRAYREDNKHKLLVIIGFESDFEV